MRNNVDGASCACGVGCVQDNSASLEYAVLLNNCLDLCDNSPDGTADLVPRYWPCFGRSRNQFVNSKEAITSTRRCHSYLSHRHLRLSGHYATRVFCVLGTPIHCSEHKQQSSISWCGKNDSSLMSMGGTWLALSTQCFLCMM